MNCSFADAASPRCRPIALIGQGASPGLAARLRTAVVLSGETS
jgi:hypothetical protein